MNKLNDPRSPVIMTNKLNDPRSPVIMMNRKLSKSIMLFNEKINIIKDKTNR